MLMRLCDCQDGPSGSVVAPEVSHSCGSTVLRILRAVALKEDSRRHSTTRSLLVVARCEPCRIGQTATNTHALNGLQRTVLAASGTRFAGDLHTSLLSKSTDLFVEEH
jgi:hypothetical protein